MTRQQLIRQLKRKNSFLCIGLDTDSKKIPTHLLSTEDPVFEFNKAIIDATKEFAVAYKLNTAFYEASGAKGWESLRKTLEYIPKDIFTIADAKRADIGNTSSMYAQAFFNTMNFDSVTVSPYMGFDSVKPFLEFDGKWAIILAATSNPGGLDFQYLKVGDQKLFEKVIETSMAWGSEENTMYVVGATRPETIKEIRQIIPNHFLLIPGVGVQGGDLRTVCENGLTRDCGLLVNFSRGIIYSDSSKNFAETTTKKAASIQLEMKKMLQQL